MIAMRIVMPNDNNSNDNSKNNEKKKNKKKNRHPEREKKRGIRLATLIHLIHVDPNF